MFTIPETIVARMQSLSWEDFVLRSTSVLIIAALAVRAFRHQSAAVRHRIWLLGLAGSIVVPALTVIVPQFSVPILSGSTRVSEPLVHVATTEEPVVPLPDDDAERSVPPIASAAAAVPSSAVASSDAAFGRDLESGQTDWSLNWRLVWAFGFVAGLLACGASTIRRMQQRRRLEVIDDEEWNKAVGAAAARLGLRRQVTTLVSDRMCVPATFGVFSARLVVPPDWRRWDSTLRDCILLHELAHVQRRDVAAQWVARIALLVHWFNPVAWFAARQLRIERELASDDCVLLAGHAPSSYATQLLTTLQRYRFRVVGGVAMAHTARLDERVRLILDPDQRRAPVGRRLSAATAVTVLFASTVLGSLTLTAWVRPLEQEGDKPAEVWKQNYTVEYRGTLPVSVAFSPTEPKLLTGDANGELMALNLRHERPTYSWKSTVGGTHPATAYSADGKTVYATTTDGVRVLDASRGKEQGFIQEENSNPIAIGVFPGKPITEEHFWDQVVFGSARGYIVKTWVRGREPGSGGTLTTSTVAEGADPIDAQAVPLAVDPLGRSAIMTGPIDPTGEVSGEAGRNVLWAYVCGDHGEGSPGNRAMPGHAARVVSAAWSREGTRAVTGDATGRVIEWNATRMKETSRRELGGRIGAIAVSPDGKRIAAYVLASPARVYVWNTGDKTETLQPIYTDLNDLSGPQCFASLSFSPAGDRLAGCAGDRNWLAEREELVGKVRVWDLATSPAMQPPPALVFNRPAKSAAAFTTPSNNAFLGKASTQGAIDFYDLDDGSILQRLRFGEVAIRHRVVASCNRWMAMEQQTEDTVGGSDWSVVVRGSMLHPERGTIPSCRALLDLSRDAKAVAVIRGLVLELWSTDKPRLLSRAPFEHGQINTARFSPDGTLLVVSARNKLIFWRWEEASHTHVELNRIVRSLAFSPDGRYLAEGPEHEKDIQIRDLASKRIVRTLANPTGHTMDVPHLAYTQGGRVLVACDRFISGDQAVNRIKRPRLFLWDTQTGTIAHQVSVPGGLPHSFSITPNELYLVSSVVGPGGSRRVGWRLDGKNLTPRQGGAPPTAAEPAK